MFALVKVRNVSERLLAKHILLSLIGFLAVDSELNISGHLAVEKVVFRYMMVLDVELRLLHRRYPLPADGVFLYLFIDGKSQSETGRFRKSLIKEENLWPHS